MQTVYVIYLIDSSGDEFYFAEDDELIRVNTAVEPKTLFVKSLVQISAHLSRLRKKHSPTCRLFALEYGNSWNVKAN
ncbi:hypothetical protein GCM10028773_21400 [Spirosoma koreense]